MITDQSDDQDASLEVNFACLTSSGNDNSGNGGNGGDVHGHGHGHGGAGLER